MSEGTATPPITPLPLVPDWTEHAGRLRLLRTAALDIVRACDDALAVLEAERPAPVQVPAYVWYDADVVGPADTTTRTPPDERGPLR